MFLVAREVYAFYVYYTLPERGITVNMMPELSAGERALGYWGKVMVEIMIIVSQIGTVHQVAAPFLLHVQWYGWYVYFYAGFCCAYLIFISENLHSVLPILPK